MVKKPSFGHLKTLRQIISEQPPGSWAAVSLDQKSVVGLGLTAEEAKLVAKAHGELEVILLRVPQKMSAALNLGSGGNDADIIQD